MKVTPAHTMRFYIAWFLLLVFLLPSSLQFEHLFESHKHETCSDASVHVHAQDLDCSIASFHFTSFQFEPFEFTLRNLAIVGVVLPYHYTQNKLQNLPLPYDLRGPPQFS